MVTTSIRGCLNCIEVKVALTINLPNLLAGGQREGTKGAGGGEEVRARAGWNMRFHTCGEGDSTHVGKETPQIEGEGGG